MTEPSTNEPPQGVAPAEMDRRLEHIRSLALALFDATGELHGLGEGGRSLLAQAAALSAFQPPDKKKQVLRQAQEWIAAQAGEAIPIQDREPVSLILALASGALKPKDLRGEDLPPGELEKVAVLAGLLSAAQGLDASGGQETSLSKLEAVSGRLIFVLDGPQAAAGGQAAAQAAPLWEGAGYPPMLFLPADEAAALLPATAPAPPDLKAGPGIRCEDSMAEAGRKVWRYQLAEMLSHEEGTRHGEDIEALHDMRVSTRRMRAAFDVFGDFFEPKTIKPFLKGLRLTGRALGRVRDLDVFMEKAQAYLACLPEAERGGLQPLLDEWAQQRESARSEMLAHLDSPAYRRFKWEFAAFLNSPGAGALPFDQADPQPYRVQEIAPAMIYERLGAVRAYDQVLSTAPIEQLHALRIEFKKFRYTVEFFREVLGETAKPVISELKRLQDHLGDLHDADVAAQILQQFLAEWEPRQTGLPVSRRHDGAGIVAYLASRHAERHTLMVTFGEAWERFNRPEFHQNLAQAVSAV